MKVGVRKKGEHWTEIYEDGQKERKMDIEIISWTDIDEGGHKKRSWTKINESGHK